MASLVSLPLPLGALGWTVAQRCLIINVDGTGSGLDGAMGSDSGQTEAAVGVISGYGAGAAGGSLWL